MTGAELSTSSGAQSAPFNVLVKFTTYVLNICSAGPVANGSNTHY